jgi:hypothetical protein
LLPAAAQAGARVAEVLQRFVPAATPQSLGLGAMLPPIIRHAERAPAGAARRPIASASAVQPVDVLPSVAAPATTALHWTAQVADLLANLSAPLLRGSSANGDGSSPAGTQTRVARDARPAPRAVSRLLQAAVQAAAAAPSQRESVDAPVAAGDTDAQNPSLLWALNRALLDQAWLRGVDLR